MSAGPAPGGARGLAAPGDEVVVSFFATMRDAFGGAELSVPLERAHSVRDLLDGLCTSPGRGSAPCATSAARCAATSRCSSTATTSTRWAGSTRLSSGGDVVSVFPQLFGG